MPTWDDLTKLTAVALFGVALFCLTLSICFTVLKVLRPTRGPRTKHFLGETVADIWAAATCVSCWPPPGTSCGYCASIAQSGTVPEWHVRNRQKARWLRRAWVFLALGVVAIAIASVFVVTHTLGIEHDRAISRGTSTSGTCSPSLSCSASLPPSPSGSIGSAPGEAIPTMIATSRSSLWG